MQWLRNEYRQDFNAEPIIAALGDSEIDKPMLENADYAVLVRSPSRSPPQITTKNLTITSDTGPQGWNKSVIDLLTKFQLCKVPYLSEIVIYPKSSSAWIARRKINTAMP